MPVKRFQLSGATLAAVQAKAAEFGPQARIVAADRVRVGGVLGSTVYQAVVEVPGAVPRAGLAPLSAARREALGALLADGPAGDGPPAPHEPNQPVKVPLPPLSTSSVAFASILDSLTAAAESRDGGLPAAPAMLVQAGDLVVLAGVGRSAADAAARIAAGLPAGALLGYGGETAAEPRVQGASGVLSMRARGVLSGQPAVLAYGLGTFRSAPSHLPELLALGADQLWLAVDVSRKHEDTRAWVEELTPALKVTALAVLGSRETNTPRTVRKLGLPVGWIDRSGG